MDDWKAFRRAEIIAWILLVLMLFMLAISVWYARLGAWGPGTFHLVAALFVERTLRLHQAWIDERFAKR